MDVAQKIIEIKKEIPGHVKLVAVSKTKPEDMILAAYHKGEHRIFGENKVQEITRKYEDLPKDIEWHYIGHLQTNKVKYLAPFVSLIHAVDSFKLLKTINKEAAKNKRIIKCLFQIHIAEEETKFGLSQAELENIVEDYEFHSLKNIEISGLMGMATNTNDIEKVKNEFTYLKQLFDSVKKKYFSKTEAFKEISMGMSGDFKLAIECGSTMVRIGSTIFGERIYNK